jgi:putative GTP pyrophosphokinase
MAKPDVATDPADVSYASSIQGLDELGRRLAEILESLFEDSAVVIHSIPWRIKTQANAERKLIANAEFSRPHDLHDLLGMRVITMFESDLDEAAAVIGKVLDVDASRTSDRLTFYGPNEFGYRSRHFVGSMSATRCELPENRKFRGRAVEIQLRTILQHAWAEIEHDLGYKPQRALSQHLRRRFSRLAALIEVADDGFSSLRTDLDAEGTARQAVGADEQRDDGEELTLASLLAYIESDTDVNLLDNRVAQILGKSLLPPGKNARQFAGYLLDVCGRAGWQTVEDVRNAIAACRGQVIQAARQLDDAMRRALDPKGRGLRPGYTLILVADSVASQEMR